MVEEPVRAGLHLLCVEVVVPAVDDGVLHVLVQDLDQPSGGRRSVLPSALVDVGEGLEKAARRVLTTVIGTGCVEFLFLYQVGAYDGSPDPRGALVRLVHLALAPRLANIPGFRWVPVSFLDLGQGLEDAVDLLAHQIRVTTLAAHLCAEDLFTVAELRSVYEAVWGCTLDPSNFRRDVGSDSAGWVATGGRRTSANGRPAALYRRGAHRLVSPVSRPVASLAVRTK